MADEFSLAFGMGGPAAAVQARAADATLLPCHAEGRSSGIDDLLLSPPTLADVVVQPAPVLVKKKKGSSKSKDKATLAPPTKSHTAATNNTSFGVSDSAEFSLRESYGVLPTPLASLSFSSSCPFLTEPTEADRQTMEDSSNGGTTKKKKKKEKQVPDSCNKEKEAVEDDDDDEERSSSGAHNKEKEVEKEEDTSSEDEDESEDEDVKSRKKAKAQKREKKNKKEKKERKSSTSVEADEKEKQVREIEDRMKRELARLEEQKERVQLELERLKSGAGAPRTSDANTTTKAKDDGEDRKERKATKKEKTKKKAEKGQKADSQQVSPRDAETETSAANADDQTERALSVLEDAQRVRLQTQDVVSASATVRTNAKKQKKKDKTDEKKDKKKEAKAKESISDGESDEVGVATTASSGCNDKSLGAVKREEEEEDGKSDDSDSDNEHERAAKKEAKKAKKEEKEKEKKRRKEAKEREKTKRKEEKQKRRGERKARKAERKLLRKKPGGSGLMSSIDSNASIGSNDQVQQRKIESALWSEFVPFILRESHSGLFASLSTRRPDGRRKPRRDADSDDNESSAGSDSESDTSSLSTSSSAASDVDDLSARSSRYGSEAPNAVPVELEQLMLGVHKFLTAVVCNAGFTGSDVFEATTGRLAGLGGLFAHPLGRNAFAVALKKLARQNTSFLLTEEGFQCILCLIEEVINAFDFKRYETDLSVARVIMNIASTFHRTLDGSTQFVQQFITAYTVWRDLMFWEKFFWDELAVAQRKGYQQLDADDDQKKASNASETSQAGEAKTDGADTAAAAESEEFVPFNPTLIFVLLHSTAYNMLNWDVDVRSVRKFVTRMCKKTCLSHDQRQSIMEIVDSFARSLLAPAEGTFDTVQRNTSSGSSDDVSRKLGVRKKSTVGGDSQTVEKKAEASWSKEVLEHVIEELSRLTEEQQKLMTRKAEEREEEEKRQEKERKKKAAADSKKGKGGKVEAGRKHLEKAMDTFQEVQLVQRSRVIEELVNTEKSYLANLMGTVQHFLEPFRRAKVVSEGEINLLFSNIEIIVGLSQTFLTRLEERLASWKADNRAPGEQFLSDIFALVFPFMKIYATYCGNFEDVNSYLHRNKNNEKLTRFIRQCELQTNHKLDLPSLLIMPVQRIPRYRLLLQELIKCTSPHHADYRKLNSALEMIKNIADFVNEQTKGSRLHAMQKNFGPKADSIVEPWRVWIKDGHLRALAIVEGAKVQIIPMYVILFNDLLVYAKSPKEYLGKVHLQEAWVKDEQDAGEMQNILQFYSPSAAFLFAANSDEEKYEWIKALATNIDRQLQVDECREKRRSVLAEITKRKKSKGKSKSKKQNKESQDGGVADPLVASAESSEDKKQKKSKKKSKAINEDLLSAFLQFHPNVIPNTAHELLTTTQRIEKTFRTLSRHFSFRNVKEPPPEGEKVKNDLDLATPPTLAFSERQLPTRASRQIPPITPPKTPAPGAPLTAPTRGRAASAASAPSPSSSSSSPWPSSSPSRADGPPPQSPRKGGGSGVEPSASLKKSSGFWGGLWSSSSNQQVTTTAATSTKGKNSTPTPPTGSSSDIFRL